MKQKMKTKNVLVVIFILIFTFISANSAEAQPIHNNRNLPENFYKRYTGIVGDTFLEMHLNKYGNNFFGTYFFNGFFLTLYGTINEKHEINLKDYFLDNKNMSTLEVLFKDEHTIIIKQKFSTYENPIVYELTEQRYNDFIIDVLNKKNSYCVNGKKPIHTDDNYELLENCSFMSIDNIQFNYNTDPLVNYKINNAILKTITSFFNYGSENYSTIDAVLNSVINFDTDSRGTDEKVDQHVFYANDNLLSIYSSHAFLAYRGNKIDRSYDCKNYDVRSGNQIMLDDLFIPNYQSALNRIAYKNFFVSNDKERWSDIIDVNSFEVNDNFLITPVGLFFKFNYLEIENSYRALGAPSVFIPYNELTHLIRRGSLLEKVINENQALLTNQTNVSNTKEEDIEIYSFKEFPSEIDGCCCYFSLNKTEFDRENWIYVDDFGKISYMAINNEYNRFVQTEMKVVSDTKTVEFFENDKYEIIVEKNELRASGYEAVLYTGTIYIKDRRSDNVTSVSFYGECGC